MGDADGRSVYERVLGEDFALLSPELRTYFSLPGTGRHGKGEGIFEVAGCRRRWLRPLFAALTRSHILFAEYGEHVPFSVENRAVGDTLAARRVFRFPGRERLMTDEMRVVDGRLHDVLGARLEVALTLAVEHGALRMRSTDAWLLIGRRRLRLPALLSARVLLTEEWEHDHQRVAVSLRHPLLGEVFAYRGTFTYAYVID